MIARQACRRSGRILVSILLASTGALAATGFARADGLFRTNICKATISSVTGQKPLTMRATEAASGLIVVSYPGTIADQRMTYFCRIEGTRVKWGSEADPERLFHPPGDENIRFEAAAGDASISIIEQHPDGSVARAVFDRTAF
jgi:hypothetical protein